LGNINTCRPLAIGNYTGIEQIKVKNRKSAFSMNGMNTKASVADPDPGSGALLTPGFYQCRVPDSGSRIPDLGSGSRISDLGSRISDLGSRISDPGSRIPDPTTAPKEEGKNIFVLPFFVATKIIKL
jgi:hypothetical protein